MSRKVTVAVIQARASIGTESHDPRPENLARALDAIRRVSRRGAQLIVFGEAYVTGYRTDDHLERYALVTRPPDQFVRQLADACRELQVHLIVGSATKDARTVHNSALLFGPEGYIGAYHKVHLGCVVFDDGRSLDEYRYFTPGTELPVFATPVGRLGIQICRDNRYPEVARVQMLGGADIIVNINAVDPSVMKFWDASTYVRAVENQVWYVMASIVGRQQHDIYAGESRVIAPDGEELGRASATEEEDLVVTIDLDRTERARDAYPVLPFRAPETYSKLTEGKARGAAKPI